MDTIKIDARDVNFWYGDFHALKGISMEIEEKSVVAFIGPSGCGKSTFLRLFNRMNDLIPATRLEGEIRIDGHNIYAKGVEVDELRKNVDNEENRKKKRGRALLIDGNTYLVVGDKGAMRKLF